MQEPLEIPYADISPIMNSSEINFNGANIQTALNALYERVRVLEDVRDYTYSYVRRLVTQSKKEFEDTLKEIERNIDVLGTADTGVVESVAWSDDIITDRTGKIVSRLDDLRFTGDVESSADVGAITHESSDIPYEFSTNGGRISGVYLKENADSVTDEIIISLTKPSVINCIDIDSARGMDIIISVTDEAGETIDVSPGEYFEPVTAVSITLTVLCNGYTVVEVSKRTDNGTVFLSILRTLDTNSVYDGAESSSESALRESLSGYDAIKKTRDLNSYTKAWERLNG